MDLRLQVLFEMTGEDGVGGEAAFGWCGNSTVQKPGRREEPGRETKLSGKGSARPDVAGRSGGGW